MSSGRPTIAVVIDRNLARLDGLHAFAMTASSGEVEADFGVFAAGLYSGAKVVRTFALAPGGVVTYLYPLRGNEKAVGHDLFRDPATRRDAQRAIDERRIVLSPPYQLRQGGLGLVGRKAVFRDGAFWGFAAMVLDLPYLFDLAGLDQPDGLQLALRTSTGKLLLGEPELFTKDPVLQRIALPDGYWEMAAIPKGGWDQAFGHDLFMFRGTGLAVALLLTALFYLLLSHQQELAHAVEERTAELEKRNDELRQEVAARQEVEENLTVRNEQFSLFVEHSPAAVAMFDRKMRYLVASRRWLTDYKISDRDVTGLSHYDIFPEIPEKWKEVHRRCLAGAVERSDEEKFVRADGSVEWVRWEVRPWHTRLGEVGGIIIFSENVTPRMLAEEALRRERDFSDKLIDSLPGVVYLYDSSMRFLRWNRRLEEVLGYSAEEVAVMNPLQFFDAGSRELVRSRIDEVFEKGCSSVEAEFISKDGSATPYYLTGLRTEINGQSCLLGVGMDISERKSLEKELLVLNRELEARVAERTAELEESRLALINMVEDLQQTTTALHKANEQLLEIDHLKSMFIASMSHELRTPLNSVIGFTSVLLEEWIGPLNDEQKENLAIVLRAGRHLLSLINDVIDVSKVEAGQIEVRVVEFDLHDLITEAVGILQKEIADKGLPLRLENLHLVMRTDRARLLQCLLNLLSNAAKYTEEGEIRVVARQRTVEEGESVAEITVADTGIGIQYEDQPRLFHPFVRFDSHLRSSAPGTGLGLYLTRKIVSELLKGDLSFTSRPGEGSSFTLSVPVTNPGEAGERREGRDA